MLHPLYIPLRLMLLHPPLLKLWGAAPVAAVWAATVTVDVALVWSLTNCGLAGQSLAQLQHRHTSGFEHQKAAHS